LHPCRNALWFVPVQFVAHLSSARHATDLRPDHLKCLSRCACAYDEVAEVCIDATCSLLSRNTISFGRSILAPRVCEAQRKMSIVWLPYPQVALDVLSGAPGNSSRCTCLAIFWTRRTCVALWQMRYSGARLCALHGAGRHEPEPCDSA
jgi:hypothetical protein